MPPHPPPSSFIACSFCPLYPLDDDGVLLIRLCGGGGGRGLHTWFTWALLPGKLVAIFHPSERADYVSMKTLSAIFTQQNFNYLPWKKFPAYFAQKAELTNLTCYLSARSSLPKCCCDVTPLSLPLMVKLGFRRKHGGVYVVGPSAHCFIEAQSISVEGAFSGCFAWYRDLAVGVSSHNLAPVFSPCLYRYVQIRVVITMIY